ncbi:MAG: cupin domain-containing protein [Planctomycetota bacterium]
MKMKNVNDGKAVEAPDRVIRKTLAYNDEAMLCHFVLKKDAKIPLHCHRSTQIGYIIKGRAGFLAEQQDNEFEAGAGDSYVFSSFVKHGTIALEDTEYVEVFVPARDEYKDF